MYVGMHACVHICIPTFIPEYIRPYIHTYITLCSIDLLDPNPFGSPVHGPAYSALTMLQGAVFVDDA